jgi:hypothetical protein
VTDRADARRFARELVIQGPLHCPLGKRGAAAYPARNEDDEDEILNALGKPGVTPGDLASDGRYLRQRRNRQSSVRAAIAKAAWGVPLVPTLSAVGQVEPACAPMVTRLQHATMVNCNAHAHPSLCCRHRSRGAAARGSISASALLCRLDVRRAELQALCTEHELTL